MDGIDAGFPRYFDDPVAVEIARYRTSALA